MMKKPNRLKQIENNRDVGEYLKHQTEHQFFCCNTKSGGKHSLKNKKSNFKLSSRKNDLEMVIFL